MSRIPLLVPRMPTTDALIPYLRRIDTNQKYTNFGPLSVELEARLLADNAAGLGPEHVTTVANCTVGLELALQALGLRAGARVLLPAITFVATATAVLRVGMVPVIADVDVETWCLTVAIAERACAESRIDAVMPVSTFGYPHNTAAWDAFVERSGVPVVIDAAGAYGNQRVGARTDVVYSFHATKSFGAGEGGAVFSADAARIRQIRKLANFGIDTRIGQLDGHGTNGKMSEYHCAVGLASFDAWEETQRARIGLYARYRARLQATCPALAYQRKPDDGVYPLMPVLLPAGTQAVGVIAALDAAGVDARRWYSPSLSVHPALRDAPVAGELAVALDIGERILGLPFFIDMTDADIDRVCSALSSALSAAA